MELPLENEPVQTRIEKKSKAHFIFALGEFDVHIGIAPIICMCKPQTRKSTFFHQCFRIVFFVCVIMTVKCIYPAQMQNKTKKYILTHRDCFVQRLQDGCSRFFV